MRSKDAADFAALEREAFDGFPYGLLVLDESGSIICRNAEAAQLIDSAGSARTCCELLGCRERGTVLAAGCLTELAISHVGPLPEVRVDIGDEHQPIAVWVAAAALQNDSSRVVLELRPGVAGDRRRRTNPHWMRGPHLRIGSLGKLLVESPEGPLRGAWLDQRAGQLLRYLIAERHRSVTVDEIGENIWPGAGYEAAGNVRYYVHALRRVLEPGRVRREPSTFIESHAGGYHLNSEHVQVDADHFDAHMRDGLARVDEDPAGGAFAIEQALADYRGEFLADAPYAEWAMQERDRLHDLASTGLNKLAEVRLEQKLIAGAARCLEHLATLQPYDEDVHRRLMTLDIMQGHHSNAIRRYAILRSRVRRTFGHDPEFTPADLA